MITILNTSIVTDYGTFEYCPSSLNEVKALLAEQPYQSAVGHASTAQIISELTGFNVPVNRMEYRQQVGDTAIVFKLNGRPPEGVILSKEQLEEIGFSFGLLHRVK